jgi:hypothetical protein
MGHHVFWAQFCLVSQALRCCLRTEYIHKECMETVSATCDTNQYIKALGLDISDESHLFQREFQLVMGDAQQPLSTLSAAP